MKILFNDKLYRNLFLRVLDYFMQPYNIYILQF